MSDQATTGNDVHMDVDENVVNIDSSTEDVNQLTHEVSSAEKGATEVVDEVDSGSSESKGSPSRAVDNLFAQQTLIKNLEQEARNDLIAFLKRKGLPEESANQYQISVSLSKSRNRNKDENAKRKSEPSSTVYFIGPDGSMLQSKTDVANDIVRHNRTSTDFSHLRVEAHEAAKLDLQSITLPATFGNIKVLSWGEIDTRIGFHSATQLWPIGYRCQQTVEGSNLNGIKKQDIICQIGVSEAGFPQFHIYNPSTDGTYIASSEANVWRKYNPQNVDSSWNPSLFNLNIELLLEGLPKALECNEYKLHCERGYKKNYFTEEEAVAAKAAILAKLGREKRTQDRQKRQSMSSEEIARNAALQKLKEAEDIELAKAVSTKSKQVRDAEKEELRKLKELEQKEKGERKRFDVERKEKQKEEDRLRREKVREEEKHSKEIMKETEKSERDKMRELERAEKEKLKELERLEKERAKEMEKFEKERIRESEKVNREKQKESERLQKERVREAERLEKERLKQFEKQRIAVRKELNTEIKKIRTDLSTLILENFDREEEIEEGTLPPEFAGIDLSSSQIVEDISLLQMIECGGINIAPSMFGTDKQEVWDRFFYVLSGINLMRQYISIDKRYTFDDFSKVIERSERPVDSNFPDSYFEAQLDRIELNITKMLLPDLHTLLELDEREGDPSRKKDKRQGACSFPLNQLTWTELARMILLNHVLVELGRSKDDRQHGIRGSKLSNFRLAKNVVRNIRYQWYLRACNPPSAAIEDVPKSSKYAMYFDHLAAIQWCNNNIETTAQDYQESKPYPIIFDSEQEIVHKLKECVDSDAYPEVYKRCCKVILRLLDLRSVENYLWEVDRDAFPDYYTIIRRPVYLSSIASKLVEKGYGYDADQPNRVVDTLFQELKQMFVNCVTYNTEYQTIVAQAIKMYMFTHHLVVRWLYDTDRPQLEKCSENYCLLSGAQLTNATKQDTIRCGKCQHNFHYPTIKNLLQEAPDVPCGETIERLKPYFLEPTPEMFNSLNEEWHCPFCLQEDSVLCRQKFSEAGIPLSEEEYFVNEWGTSSIMPWIFSEKHSSLMDFIRQHYVYLVPLLEALKVLSSAQKTCFQPSGDFLFWTAAERITVLSALLEVTQNTPKALEHLKSIHDDCANVMRMCAKPTFREADFMTSVRDLSGEDAMKCCRVLLDGIDSSNVVEPFLQSFLTEGRCIICNTTTYEEEEEGDEINTSDKTFAAGKSNNPVILCDGCNAEAHLKCLGLASVPSDAWYCSVCIDRQARRDRVTTTVEHVDQWRDKEEEDRLLNECINSKIPELCAKLTNESQQQQTYQCAYCGMSEFEVCSPFVIGQSRAEHEDWVVSMTRVPVAANFLFPQSNCNVNFLHGKSTLALPKISCPNFPLQSSEEGKKLAELYESFDRKPLVVHQLCALQMFQARSNRSRHLLRRRRNIVGEKALSMSGISQQPLGYDVYHNEYWKFPFCSDLFVKISGLSEPNQSSKLTFSEDHKEFNRMIGRVEPDFDSASSASTSVISPRWIRITDLDTIKSIASSLGATANEQQLRLNLIKEVIVDKTLLLKDSFVAVTGSSDTAMGTTASSNGTSSIVNGEDIAGTVATTASSTAVTNAAKRSTEPSDASVPVALKLFLTKGVEVPSSVVIHEEAAFVDSVSEGNGSNAEEEEEEGISHLSFNTKSKKYFAIGLVNSSGGLIKTANLPQYGNYNVVYQVHRDGYSQPIVTAALSEPWTDHMYYFCTILFKKSGNYTVSFLVEGTNKAGSIRPLIFPVIVHASSVRCGIPDALHRLQARHYKDSAQRQITGYRREFISLTLSHTVVTEFAAVKAALATLYLALPYGALVSDDTATATASSSNRAALGGVDKHKTSVTAQLLEPTGWDGVMEIAWKNALVGAETPQELMECVLLLEFYLNRAWLVAPNSRLLSALPSAHFAMRAVTLSSVALRIYSIDKALAYEKVQAVSRELRRSATASAAVSNSYYDEDEGYFGNKGGGSGKKDRNARYMNRTGASTIAVAEESQGRKRNSYAGRNAIYESVIAGSSGRQRRAASTKLVNYRDVDEDEDDEEDHRRKSKRSRMEADDEEEDDEEEEEEEESSEEEEDDNDDDEEEEVVTSSAPSVWLCSTCGMENAARARSCETCQSRKLVTGAIKSKHQSREKMGQRRLRATGRTTVQKRKRVRRSSSSDEDEEEEEVEEEDEDEDGDEDGKYWSENTKRVARGSPAKKYQYNDDDDDEEAEFDAPPPSASRRSSGPFSASKSKRKTPEEIEFEKYVESLPEKIETLSRQMVEFKQVETDGIVDMFLRAMSLIRLLMKDERSQAFWEPVDLDAVPMYSNYVKEPMDLGTILSRLRYRAYADDDLPKAFADDVKLVFRNCQAYNLPGSLLYVFSEELEKKFDKFYKAWMLAPDRPVDPIIPIPSTAK